MLRKWNNWILAVGLTSALSMAPAARAADEMKIATVDMQRALQTVDAGKKARAQLEKEFNAKKKTLQEEETSIKKMGDEFKKQQSVMNDDARNKKQAEIQGKIMALQQETAKSQQELQQKEHDLTTPIIAKLRQIIADVANSRGYSLVLEKNENTVLYSKDKDDLTDDVIKAYDKQAKKTAENEPAQGRKSG